MDGMAQPAAGCRGSAIRRASGAREYTARRRSCQRSGRRAALEPDPAPRADARAPGAPAASDCRSSATVDAPLHRSAGAARSDQCRPSKPVRRDAARRSALRHAAAPAADHAAAPATPCAPVRAVEPTARCQTAQHAPQAQTTAQQPLAHARTPHRIVHRRGAVHGTRSDQARLNTSVPLVPPKPKLFLTATSIFISRAVVGAVVEIALRILVEDVDRRRRHLVVQRQHREHRLDAAGAAEQVAGHRLGRVDHQLLGVVAEGQLDRVGLVDVAERRRGAVRVEVLDLVGVDAGVAQRRRHRAASGRRRWARSCGTRRRSCRSRQLGVDLGAARLGVLVLLEHQHAGALAQHEAVAVLVPGTGGRRRDRRCGSTARAPRRSRRCRAARRSPRRRRRSSRRRRRTRSCRPAMPMQCRPVVQAVTIARFGPLKPYLIETWPEIMLMIEAGTKNGEIAARAAVRPARPCVSSISGRPPMPEPMLQPMRSASSSASASPVGRPGPAPPGSRRRGRVDEACPCDALPSPGCSPRRRSP